MYVESGKSELSKEALKLLSKVEKDLIETQDPGFRTVFEIVRVLSQGEKTWTDLAKDVKAHHSSMDLKLKYLLNHKMLERKVVPVFRPRTVYKLGVMDPQAKKLYSDLKQTIDRTYELAAQIADSVASKKPTRELYNLVMKEIALSVKNAVRIFLSFPPDRFKDNKWVPLFVRFYSILILLLFWTACESFAYNEKTRAEVLELAKKA